MELTGDRVCCYPALSKMCRAEIPDGEREEVYV